MLWKYLNSRNGGGGGGENGVVFFEISFHTIIWLFFCFLKFVQSVDRLLYNKSFLFLIGARVVLWLETD